MTTTTATITAPQSAGTFLFGEDTEAALHQRLTDTDALHRTRDGLSLAASAVRARATREVAGIATGFLTQDLAAIAVSGWRKHRALIDAARRTLDSTATAVVPLAGHSIAFTPRHRIDVELGGATVGIITFELSVTITMVGLAAVVRGGSLVAFEGGQCEVTATFSAATVPLAERTAQFDPHLALPLGSGLRLLAATPPAPRRGGGASPRDPGEDGASDGGGAPTEPPA